MSATIKRNEWIFEHCLDAEHIKNDWEKTNILNMLNRSIKMFDYENLPDTIEDRNIEVLLQCNGFAIWAKADDDKLYVFYGGLGGEPNAYYLPTIAIVANPYLKFNKSLIIDKECVVMINDYFYQGVLPTLTKYAKLQTEAEITLNNALYNARIPAIASADNDNAYESLKTFFEGIKNGIEYGAILSKSLMSGLSSHDFTKNPHIIDSIEAIQYVKGSAYAEIGLQSQFNMKREAINSAEATLNEDVLFPYIHTLLKCRRKGIDAVNKMFGTNIRVKLGSVWANNERLQQFILKQEENESNEKNTA